MSFSILLCHFQFLVIWIEIYEQEEHQSNIIQLWKPTYYIFELGQNF
jgi:hypothetical protein